ncbi:MAG: hypothetical protein A2Y89_04605 [Chloroflexi bacterium RBG_13_51_18]|nr:MAG: hypothetical protein A2Y89_04605 [Chloroflexi bacterium RBG_13_51_18]
MNLWLKRLSRISAWALLACVVLLVFSGWGITHAGIIYNITFGLVDKGTANTIHNATVLPLAFFFLLHVLINIKFFFSGRRPVVAWVTNGILITIGGLLLVLVIYMEYFYR